VAPPAGAVGDPADNGAVDAHAGHQH
jgi:hypothetical protein